MDEHISKLGYIFIGLACLLLAYQFIAKPIQAQIKTGGEKIQNADYTDSNNDGGTSKNKNKNTTGSESDPEFK